ncbi:unnamed protein product [Soboliphyme baturini]|uniref:Cartilage matrix protein n=1 Tax=Soboliphyme baturini TaxID=241478 RepID=A0A183IMM5_9BILA|nr:unnamed protein product [Soboliphyme baturini]
MQFFMDRRFQSMVVIAGVDNCQTGKKECDPNASCINLSTVINECDIKWMNDCSPFATCVDTEEGHYCQCQSDYIDVSSRYNMKPGRKCVTSTNECADARDNSCDPEAHCIDTPEAYICTCPEGYRDVSSNANLPPGRVCTLQTVCPAQPTDLIFLIDGSGSIGSEVFKTIILKFIQEFITLFNVSSDQTRIGVIQYSDEIQSEFYLYSYNTPDAVRHAISMINSEHGSRPSNKSISRVAIVITDGRAQDNVLAPANEARSHGISLFSVGVTGHVLESELEQIAGSKDRYVVVGRFADLNTRLRALIQKEICKEEAPPKEKVLTCSTSQTDQENPCDRSRNEVCINGACGCGPGFCFDNITGECGRLTANNIHVQIIVPFSTGRTCDKGFEENPETNRCELAGSFCKPACDQRKKEKCLPDVKNKGNLKCQCPKNFVRDPVTQICTIDECAYQIHNCSQFATCTDTFDGFLCTCWENYIDRSEDPVNLPGRVCVQKRKSVACRQAFGLASAPQILHNAFSGINPCEESNRTCSPDADCYPTAMGGYICACREGFLDMSPNVQQAPGQICQPKINECESHLDDCSKNADCTDTDTGYICRCKAGYKDLMANQLPGRKCVMGKSTTKILVSSYQWQTGSICTPKLTKCIQLKYSFRMNDISLTFNFPSDKLLPPSSEINRAHTDPAQVVFTDDFRL